MTSTPPNTTRRTSTACESALPRPPPPRGRGRARVLAVRVGSTSSSKKDTFPSAWHERRMPLLKGKAAARRTADRMETVLGRYRLGPRLGAGGVGPGYPGPPGGARPPGGGEGRPAPPRPP